jgi:hypothetical protein
MGRLGPWCALLIIISATAGAQDSAADQAQAIKSLMERVTVLEQEVSTLKEENQKLKASQQPGESVESSASAVPQAAASQPDHEIPSPETYPNLKLRGFGNVDYTSADSRSQPSGFTMGQFVMHFSSALSAKTSLFAELSFTAQAGNYTADLERAIIRYDLNDYLKVSFGRYHTPVNYWNTAFHHGAWLQTTISRPEMIRFGGRFLPVHFLGALTEGVIPSGPLGLNYNVGLGNGRQTIPLLSRDGDAGDVNSNRAFVASLFARPAKLYGLQIGGSVYQDKITPDSLSLSQANYREWITSGYVAYERERPEFLAEFANVRHRDFITNQEWNSQGAYGQVAYRLPRGAHKLKPYYRFEYIHVPASEPVLLVPELNAGHTLGTRFDITDFAALKFEYRHWRRSDTDKFQGFYGQTAFTF